MDEQNLREFAEQGIKILGSFLEASAEEKALRAEAEGLQNEINRLKAELVPLSQLDGQLAAKREELAQVNAQLDKKLTREKELIDAEKKKLKAIVVAHNEFRSAIAGRDIGKNWEAINSEVSRALS